jgi:hypothetical protein
MPVARGKRIAAVWDTGMAPGMSMARSWFVVSTLSRPLGPSRFPSLALNSRQYM